MKASTDGQLGRAFGIGPLGRMLAGAGRGPDASWASAGLAVQLLQAWAAGRVGAYGQARRTRVGGARAEQANGAELGCGSGLESWVTGFLGNGPG